ncbi:MAG: pyridoxal phosphate-dependent aminotransferase [Lachnospiraceae bacterium]|nr:pyridoxal phosphate-dependent aminotransferase [Lachnospiraceae bacterium]
MLAKRIQNLTPSATGELFAKVAQLKEQGVDVISFNVGEPDFQTPEEVIEECKKAMDAGKTKYAPVAGITELKEAICCKLKNENQVAYEKNQICISTGAKHAVYNAVMAVCDPGDEIILPIPCWVSYVEMIKLAGGVPVLVPTKEDYQLDLNAIEESITERTKGIILNTPNNPTGACYRRESLLQLGELAVQKDFYIISDEIYEKLIYDDNEHICVSSLSKEIYDRTILINGFSKAYAMTGWRIGYTAASTDIIEGITGFQGHVTSNSTTFVQWAAVRALQMGDDTVVAMRDEFKKRRDFMYQTFCELPDITCVKPGGAFYLMPDVSAYFGKEAGGMRIKDSADFCMYMLEEAKIAIVPGKAFFMPNAVRFAYTDSMERLQEGMRRFKEALLKIK